MLENKTYDEIQVGDEATIKRVCTGSDLYVFAHASGNLNPLHLPEDIASRNGNGETVAPSMWVGALISSVLGNVLPGPGTLYHSQNLTFLDRAHVGDEMTIKVKVLDKLDGKLVKLATEVQGRGGDAIARGEAQVYAPSRKIQIEDTDLPSLELHAHRNFPKILAECEDRPALRTAVVAPESAAALAGALLAAEKELIAPVLIGSLEKIECAAREIKQDLGSCDVIEIDDYDRAAHYAAQLAAQGEVEALMKGALHTDQFLRAALSNDYGLRRNRRISHVFAFDVPGLDHLLMLTDAAINIAPTLEDKVDIVQNAIDLAQSLGNPSPKVGILSAVETVNPKITSTLEAAILSKMAERDQIRGGVVDGPLAMDNAINLEAARAKGIKSLVAGRADILVAPNLEAGNMLAKELIFASQAQGAGIVVGAKVPIILTSRADNAQTRLVSCAIANLQRGAL